MTDVWIVAILAGGGTYVLRSYLLLRDRFAEGSDPRVAALLGLVPSAVLAALALPQIVWVGGDFRPLGPRALAAVVAGAIAWFSRSVLLTVFVGLAGLMLFEEFIG